MPIPSDLQIGPLQNAREIAYHTLRSWILDGVLVAGEIIRDTELAGHLRVSRTPVREALIRLAQEGLVEVQRGRATRVAEPRFHRAPALFQVGAELDGLACELAAPAVGPPELAAMRRILDEMANNRDEKVNRKLDEQFHLVYYEASGNEVILSVMAQINEELRRLEVLAFSDPVIRESAHLEHLAILEALERGDAAAARQAGRANWHESWARIRTRLAGVLLPDHGPGTEPLAALDGGRAVEAGDGAVRQIVG